MNSDGALPLCKTCSTQYDASHDLKACHICDDPRQYILPSGQAWTTLSELWQDKEQNYKNIFTQPYDGAPNIWTIRTEPVFGIGQRAFLLQTQHGNVLWDCVGYIDQDTVDKINTLGGLKAIVISHPHFYSTHITWSRIFGDIPVYLASDDKMWLSRTDDAAKPVRRFVEEKVVEILPGVTAIKVGGHFPGSMVLHWADTLFVADSIGVVMSGLNDANHTPKTTSFSFMWSYPNMIPLPPKEIANIVKSVLPFKFSNVHGAFDMNDVKGDISKVIKSARIIINAMGYDSDDYLGTL